MKNTELKDWKLKLQVGDRVKWNDPDGDICSRVLTIASIEYVGKTVARITESDGSEIEVFLSELSKKC